MALVLADRVKETTTTTGTGTVTLAGAATGFQSFAVVGNGNTTYYTIAGQGTAEWEVGIGTYTSAGTTLARTTVLASSNAGSLVVFSAGTKDVFVTYPAGRSIYANGTVLTASNSSVLPTTSGGTNLTSFTANGVVYASSTSALATGSVLQFTADGLGIGAAANTSPGGAYYNLNIGTQGGGGIISAGTDIYFTSNCYITGGNNYFAYSGSAYASYYNQNAGKHQWKTSTTAGTGGGVATLTTVMLLDASGNLGLGVTPSAWGSAYKMFQASSQASFGGNSSNITIVGSNYYNDGASKYIGTGLAALYLQDSGLHKWYNAPSGTAGNAITFTQAMTLDASGNLLVGDTTYRLSGIAAAGQAIQLGSRTFIGSNSTGDTSLGGLSGSNFTAFYVNGAEKARLDASGFLGLNKTPARLLDMTAATAVSYMVSSTGTNTSYYAASNTGGAIYIGRENSVGGTFGTTAYAGVLWSEGAYPLVFATNNTERMRIDSSGNVGIGTTSITEKLTVAGNITATGNIAAGNGMIVNTNTVSANYSIASGSNAMSAGPVSVNTGIVVTIPTGSVWTVV